MNYLKNYQKVLVFGNSEIAYLVTRAMRPLKEKECVSIDPARLSNELKLYKYNTNKSFPSILSALIPIVVVNSTIEHSYEEACHLLEHIRRKKTVQNKMGIALLCHLLYNADAFHENFAQYKMMNASKEEEVAFQKAKIDVILGKTTVKTLILDFLEEQEKEKNAELLDRLLEDVEHLSGDALFEPMSVYFEKVRNFLIAPKPCEASFDIASFASKKSGDKGVDAFLGEYFVEAIDYPNQTISLRTKRGRLTLSLPTPKKPAEKSKAPSGAAVVRAGSLEERFSLTQLRGTWMRLLEREREKPYFQQLLLEVDELYAQKVIYPEQSKVFRALIEVPYEQTKVVILGQDPYHGPNQANGMCFSVNEEVKAPPSLVNIFKELQNEYGQLRTKVDLSDWASQGVLLLNSVLTVEAGQAGSHARKGWEVFTDAIVEELNKRQEPVVFILWGSYAAAKAKNVDESRHLVLKSNHPSPLSAHRGFFGNEHFILANRFLTRNNQNAVLWI